VTWPGDRARCRGHAADHEAAIDLATQADVADLGEVLVAIDGEDDAPAAHARRAAIARPLQWLRMSAVWVIGDLLKTVQDALTRRQRQSINIALGWARDVDPIAHSLPRMLRRSSSSVT
jgi:hypothetical protein